MSLAINSGKHLAYPKYFYFLYALYYVTVYLVKELPISPCGEQGCHATNYYQNHQRKAGF